MAEILIQMAAQGTGGTQNSLANIDIPEDARLTLVDWTMVAALNADAEVIRYELSFIATNQLDTNDVRGVITVCGSKLGLLTSGAGTTSVNKAVPMSIIVAGGERIYLHADATAGVVSNVNAILHFEVPTPRATRRSQRRRS